MSDQTFRIAGNNFCAVRWPKPSIDWSLEWVLASSKNHYCSDRGAAQDVYSAEFTLYDTEDALNNLQNVLASSRYQVTMSDFGEALFAPNVNHTGSINASIMARGIRKAMGFAAGGGELFEMRCKATAIQPTKLSLTPSLSVLRLQHGYEADKSFEARAGFSYDQTVRYTDTADDVGIFNFKGLQSTAELQQVLAYILASPDRGVAFTMPTIAGEPYPFGIVRGAGPFQAKIRNFSFTRRDFQMWDLGIQFVEHA